MVKDYLPLSDFTRAFAREYKAFMVANDIKGYQIANKLGRNESYVSVRANGKRALDTQDVDALAMLAGWEGEDLLLELARRARDAGYPGGAGMEQGEEPDAPLAPVTELRREPVEGMDDELAAASTRQDDPNDSDEHFF